MLTGAILAGGKSKRFGVDKRFFKFGKKTLLEIACEKIKNFDEKYIAIDKNFDISKLPKSLSRFKIIRDKFEDKGPMVGIYSMLLEIENEGSIFIPVDMPLIPEELLIYMANLKVYDIVYLKNKDRIYPLPGYYSKRLVSLIEENVKLNRLSLMELIFKSKGIKIFGIDYENLKKFGNPEKILININKPEDLISI